MRRVPGPFLLVALALAGGCHPSTRASVPPAAVKTVAHLFDIRVGGRIVHMQIALAPEEMEHGLMFRRTLAADEGMLFVYAVPQRMRFWMRNTPVPLDIGFFDPDGVLREIYPMYPYDERTVSSIGHDLRFALEMNQGWYENNAVRPGAKIDIGALAAAVRARGYDPKAYGL
ncbi:MAG: DUF192 domain-containing protein [Opitutaceae bacterium]